MVVRMNWMVVVRKWIIVLVIFCLIGPLTQACHDHEEEKPPEEEGSDIKESKWFIILERLIERYPIIGLIIERIFQWIFNNLLDLDY